jgi:hypothetical protein
MKPISAWCLGFFIALTFFWVSITSSGFEWKRQWRLAQASAEADAFVYRTEPHNHCLVHYQFEVDGEQYRGKGPGGCSAVIGDKVHVYYLPGQPAFSTLKTPGHDLSFVIVAPIVLSTIAGFITMVRLGRPGK